jgi:superfamily II DNA helicase RecQ
MELTPFSPQIVETLRVLIAPGDRMRLSPFVDEAQIRVLFGEQVDPRSRFESTRRIINAHREVITQIAREFVKFLENRRGYDWTRYYRNDLVRKSWLINNFPVNVCKVQMALLELVLHGKLDGEINLVDIGIGAGNVPVAVIDFLVAWAAVCQLYGLELPVTRLSYCGYDVVEEWLQLTREVVSAYLEVLDRRIAQAGDDAGHIYEFLTGFGDRLILEKLDLNAQVLEVQGGGKAIVFLCNVLSELDDQGKTNLMCLLDTLPQDSAAVVIEPGDEQRTRRLNDWRRGFLASPQGEGWSIVAPCGSEFGRELPEVCSNCWNLRRDSFHETQLYRAFREESNRIRSDRRSWDEYENNLLSQSYTILHKSTSTSAERSTLRREQGLICGTTRYIGEHNNTLKLCPAAIPKDGYSALTLELSPACAVPNLRFGDRVTIHGCDSIRLENGTVRIRLLETAQSYIENLDSVCVSRPPDGFLPRYDDRTKRAIDELAFRFFGFERMREFQHDVLRHVLRGKSIFAIAATGGGKSECYILPALLLPGLTIVIAPLRSLMQDQYEQRLRNRYGFGDISTFINGDVPLEERQKRLRRMEQGYYKIVYFTPEQLEREYVLSSLRRAHEKVGLRYIALDEAHCISQWGHDFRPSYLNIVKRLKNAGIDPLPVRIALTATASPKVREDVCRELLLDPRSVDNGGDLYVHSSNRPELNFVVRICGSTSEKVEDMIRRLEDLKRDYPNDAAIIFMPHTGGDPDSVDWSQFQGNMGRESSGVTEFASYLERALGEKVCIYHSKMEDEVGERTANVDANHNDLGNMRGRTRRTEQEKFINGERRIMVATKGFGMGIDKPNIRLVLHRTPPANLEAYIQEAGRAGRDGNFATVVLYFSKNEDGEHERSDTEIQNYFIYSKYISREDVDTMVSFLRNCSRRACDTIYFTDDEVIEFSDQQQQPQQFDQSELLNERYYYRPPAVRDITIKGNIRKSKTAHIQRILSAMYSFRPGGQGLIDYCQKVGIQMRNPQVVNAEAIMQSNYYFGEILRQRGMTPNEFRHLVEIAQGDDGIIPLAQRLGMTLYEVHAMLQDIRSVGRERGRGNNLLLEFNGIFAPKYGPARNRSSLRDWLNYAGAISCRSEREALENARERGSIQRLCQMCNAPRSSNAQSWINTINDELMARIGRKIRNMREGRESERVIQHENGIIKFSEEIDELRGLELIYYRVNTAQKIGYQNEERFRVMQRNGQFDQARAFLINACRLQPYEAMLFGNSNIKCVGVRRTSKNNEMIVYLHDPAVDIEDWFGWVDCPNPVGWEVRLSDAFRSEEQLNALIDAFMKEHDQRKQDDENAFRYLLNDYIGME